MAELSLAINGRFEEGETLQAMATEVPYANWSWQAWTGGGWIPVGSANSLSYTIPAGAAGTSYRLVAFQDGETFFSPASPVVTVDTKHETAPVLSGWDPYLVPLHFGAMYSIDRVFSKVTFSDPDKHDYHQGSLVLQNSNSLAAGGDGQDTLFIQSSAAGHISYDETSHLISHLSFSGDLNVIGEVDSVLDGAGTDLQISLTRDATPEGINALIDALGVSTVDGAPESVRLLTMQVTDSDGASAQVVRWIEFGPGEPFPEVTLVGTGDAA